MGGKGGCGEWRGGSGSVSMQSLGLGDGLGGCLLHRSRRPPGQGEASGQGGEVWGRRAVHSLGAVVPVVVDVDSGCDATDNEWDPSRDQIEPGEEWVWGSESWGTRRGPGPQNPHLGVSVLSSFP